jgi:UDP-2,3-diacylglucosamine pyrophosphatase LpxH
MILLDLIKQEIEKYGLTIEQYEQCLKDAYDKVNGINDMDWSEIIHKYNLNIHRDTLRKATQTIFGGAFVCEYFKNKNANSFGDDTYSREIQQQKRDLEKEKIKCRDERIELQRLIREQARQESFIDLVKRAMSCDVEPFDYKYCSRYVPTNDEMIVCLSDIHAGINVKNSWNKYDVIELSYRLKKYLDEIIEIQQTHHCDTCYLILGGDLISGLIHRNLRLQNNENVVEQVKIVSTYIGNFINELLTCFNNIQVHSVSGNHSRLSPNKEEHLKGEELDALIPFYLKLKFNNCENVQICDNTIDDTILSFRTKGGHLFYGVHGDKDGVKNVVQNLTLMTGVKPDGIILGHRHHNAYDTEHNVKIIQCGCVVGSDDYCIDKRISGRPEQCVVITNNERTVKCIYDVPLVEG